MILSFVYTNLYLVSIVDFTVIIDFEQMFDPESY